MYFRRNIFYRGRGLGSFDRILVYLEEGAKGVHASRGSGSEGEYLTTSPPILNFP